MNNNTQQPEVPVTYPIKFSLGQALIHKKTQGEYLIVGLPDKNVLEETREPAYAYLMQDGRICNRRQSEMEDGRFVPISTHAEWMQQAMEKLMSNMLKTFENIRYTNGVRRNPHMEIKPRVRTGIDHED